MLIVKIGNGLIMKEKISFGNQNMNNLGYRAQLYNNSNMSNRSSQNFNVNQCNKKYERVVAVPKLSLSTMNNTGVTKQILAEKITNLSRKRNNLDGIITKIFNEYDSTKDDLNLMTLAQCENKMKEKNKKIEEENEKFEKIIYQTESIKDEDKKKIIKSIYTNTDISTNTELRELIRTYKTKLISNID